MGVRFVIRSCEGKKLRTEIEFPFEQARIVLGRGSSADVRIPHRTVSELHASVAMRGDAWMLTDAGSTNGTKLNGQALSGDRSRRLSEGDRIEVGAYVLSFHTGVFVPEPVSADRTAELARRILRDAYAARSQPLPAPRLCVVTGPDTGKLLEIKPAPSRAVIGHKPGCALELAAAEVALEHLEVVHDQDGVLMRGLGDQSFRVGEHVQRVRRLRDGDEVCIGETRLFFEEPAQEAIEALKNEPDVPWRPVLRAEPEPVVPPRAEPEAPKLEPMTGLQPQAASGRSDADVLIYALAAIVLIASTLGLLVLLRSG
jgi:predicted component of type VI protein secretion system